MTNHDRNMRTLIVCFLCAVFALVPLRFVELGNAGYFNQGNQSVLGVNDQMEEVVLPEADVESCFTAEEVETKVNSIAEIIKNNDLEERVVTVLQEQIDEIVNNQCK